MNSELWNSYLAWLATTGLQIVITLALACFVLLVLRSAITRSYRRIGKDKDEEQKKRLDTLATVSRMAATVLVLAVATMVALGEQGVPLGPILTTAGVLGLAVGLGAQGLVQDVISGFFLVVEDQIRVGDWVGIGDKSGRVNRVTLRSTELRGLDGNVHFIKNGKIDVVTNMTKGFSRYVFDVGVAYRENVDEVIKVIQQVDEDMRNDEHAGANILEPIEIMGLDRFDDSAMVVRARTKTKPCMQWEVAREFNRRLKERFDELDIEIPFPHQTIYFGVDKQGQAPPLRMVKQEEEK